jgi:hypothetical protein
MITTTKYVEENPFTLQTETTFARCAMALALATGITRTRSLSELSKEN